MAIKTNKFVLYCARLALYLRYISLSQKETVMPKLLLILVSIFAALAAMGQKMVSPKTFSNIDLDGEAGVVYYSLCQDSTGMIWLGTNMGLCSYDGYRVRRHLVGDGSSTNINCLVPTDSLLIAGADTGVLFYNPSAGEYVGKGAIGFPRDVRSLALDGSGLWIGSLNGLFLYDILADSLREVSVGLTHRAVYAVQLTYGGDVYAGTYNGLCRYDRVSGRWAEVKIDAVPQENGNLFVNALADDPRRHCLWMGTEGALYRYDYDRGVAEADGRFAGQSIKSLAICKNGNLVVGTDDGLFVCNERRMECYKHDSRMASSLSSNVVWSVMEDRDGNLWAGTESGLSEWVNGGDFTVVPLYQLSGSSDGSRFYSIFRDSRGYLWLGGTYGLIRRSPDGQIKWYKADDKSNPLKHNRVRSIYEDSRYELWVATDGGINRYDYVAEQFVNYTLTDSLHTHNANWAYGIVEDRAGMMWVGSYLGGLLGIDRGSLVASAAGKYVEAQVAYNSTNGLPSNMVTQLAVSPDGSKWALLYKSGKLVHIKGNGSNAVVNVLDVDSLHLQYIVADRRDGGLWCGLHGGIVYVSTADTVGCRYAFPQALDVDVHAMAMVRGNLWVSTSLGVWVLDPKTGDIRHLRLPGRLYTSIYYDRATHRVLLGGHEELVVVNPSILKKEFEPREIDITAIYVNDKFYAASQADGGLRLPHDRNRIAVEFSDFDYNIDNRKSFEYRIVNGDGRWTVLPSDDNSIELGGLAPGDYELEIRSLGGVAPSAAKSLHIKIEPAWYASWWAITGYVLLCALFVLWVMNFLRLKLRLRMERVRSEKTLEAVNSRMEFLTNISHELKTPLSMIIGPLSKMLNEERNPDTRHHLEVIQQNALKLNTLIHRALEVNRMDANPDNLLIYSQVEMVAFCRSIFETYRESFPAKQFVFNCAESRIIVNADAVKMESVINNLLSNACKYSGDGSTVVMSLSLRDGNVVIAVSDTGVGIPCDELPLVFQRLYQSSATKGHKDGTGIGLYLAKTYVEMHHGTIDVQSTVGEGSVFTVTVPVGDVDEQEVGGTPVDADDWQGKLRVLIVEDNAAIAAFIKEVLSDSYHCLIADNGKAGLAVCNSVQPDLIIADMMMPVMDGMEMCRRIRRNPHLAAVPIILLTAKDDRITEAESIKVGIDAFMSKPFEAGMLKGRVEQLLKSKEAIRSNLRVESITAVRHEDVDSADEKLLADVTKVIEDNISDSEMNVGYVCDKTGLSSKQLYRMLKKLVGVSPVDYIRQIRMKKAAMLLSQHKFTVSEVMYMVGFSSTSYFSKCFSAQFGCTPREYAEKHSSTDI